MQCNIPSIVSEVFGSDVSIESVSELETLEHSSVARVYINHPVRSIIIKENNSLAGLDLARREATFYASIAPLLSRGVSPECYGATRSSDALVLVLEDLSSKSESSFHPSLEESLASYVEALARLSLSSSEAEHLEDHWNNAFGVHPYNYISGRAKNFPDCLGRFLAKMGHEIPRDVASLLNSVTDLAYEPEFQRGDVVVHGDAHFGNAIALRGEFTLLDWANTALGFGEIDLAHLLALNLPPDSRRAFEPKVLNSYAQRTGSEVSSVRRRYKLGVLYAIESAIGMWEFGVPTWKALLRNAVEAAVDLDARSELTGGSL